MQKLTFSLPTIQKPSKEDLRRWLIGLGIAAILACCLWAFWSMAAASASASDVPVFHPSSHQGGGEAPVPDRHNPSSRNPFRHLANNAGGQGHVPYLGEIHGSGSGDGAWFIPPADIHPFYNFSAGGDGFGVPGGGNWHDFGNQSRGLGISGPGGGGGGGGSPSSSPKPGPADPQDNPPTGSSPPPDGQGPTDPTGNPPGELTSAVPEPATWAMFLIGFGAIGWMLRFARRQRGTATP